MFLGLAAELEARAAHSRRLCDRSSLCELSADYDAHLRASAIEWAQYAD
jgi:hypothetical protein